MKILSSLFLVLAAAVAARADIVFEQMAEGPAQNAKVIMKIKGHLARMDIISASSTMTTLMDLKTEKMTIVAHSQKLIMEKDMKAVRRQTEDAQRAAGLDPSAVVKTRATGTVEKVGNWMANLYEFKLGEFPGKVWVVMDFPNGQALRDELKKVTAANNGGFDPNKLDVPGMIVKCQLSTQSGPITSTLLRAGEEPVSDAEFILPHGYNEIAQPPISGAAK